MGGAGRANPNILQVTEWVQNEDKMKALLNALTKTAPPCLVFTNNTKEADDILEYMLIKKVRACAIHGGLPQEERLRSINEFKAKERDVLIGTDVASKGLDFPAIKHVINYDMPKEIENYIHRIGRTGRGGRHGMATTFLNQGVEEVLLLDLKGVLQEAKAYIPPFLRSIEGAIPARADVDGVKGCAFCGGLGHRIGDCPKLEQTARQEGASKDVLSSGSRHGERGFGGDW